MPLETLTDPDGRINIQHIETELPQKKEKGWFRPERFITEEYKEKIRERLLARLEATIKSGGWEEFSRLFVSWRILFPGEETGDVQLAQWKVEDFKSWASNRLFTTRDFFDDYSQTEVAVSIIFPGDLLTFVDGEKKARIRSWLVSRMQKSKDEELMGDWVTCVMRWRVFFPNEPIPLTAPAFNQRKYQDIFARYLDEQRERDTWVQFADNVAAYSMAWADTVKIKPDGVWLTFESEDSGVKETPPDIPAIRKF